LGVGANQEVRQNSCSLAALQAIGTPSAARLEVSLAAQGFEAAYRITRTPYRPELGTRPAQNTGSTGGSSGAKKHAFTGLTALTRNSA